MTLIRSGALAARAEYAYAATASADARLIFLAGSCPLNLDGSTHGIEGVAALGYDHQLVEIEATAAVID